MSNKSNENKRICKATRRSAGHIGEPCKNRAVPGSDYCKFHGGGSVGKRKHGAYTLNLTPEEQTAYDALFAELAEPLGDLDPYDRRLIHVLALFSVKVDSAVCANAPPAAVTPYARLVLEHMRELKATRASKDGGAQLGNTPADVMAALFLKVTGGQQPDPVDRAIPVEAKVVEALPTDGDDLQDPEA